jgi:hypothetical protein
MRGRFRESELVEAPPHQAESWFSVLPCCPLHSPSKTGVNALMASGARDASLHLTLRYFRNPCVPTSAA